MESAAIAFVLMALAAGLAGGWLVASRPAAELRRRAREMADTLARAEEMRNVALRDLAVEKERADQAAALRERLDKAQAEREAAIARLAALEAEGQARAESFEAQIRSLNEAREQLSAQFSEIGGKLLGEAQRAFLERADQRFSQAHEKSEAQLKHLLQPIGESIKRHDGKIDEIERARTEAYGELKGLMDSMRTGQERVQAEAQKLVNSLRAAPKARGRWGEQSLRNVLEQAGLSPYADFREEVSVETDDGRLRPDVIVSLPGERELIIDAKCSLNAYLDAANAEDEPSRKRHLENHAASIRRHVQQLGAKDYWARFGKAADYVVMYIPGEHFLIAALEEDDALWQWALERRVLLATPTNLIAIARTVAAVWRQEKMAEEAKRIGELGKEIYERLAVAAGKLGKMGRSLNSAVKDYNDFTTSFESRALVTGRKLRDLNIESSKEIEELKPIDSLANGPAAPEASLLPSGQEQEAAE